MEGKENERRASGVRSIKEDLSNDASVHNELCNSRVRDRMPSQRRSAKGVPLHGNENENLKILIHVATTRLWSTWGSGTSSCLNASAQGYCQARAVKMLIH
jgi:hypothetical protein